MEEDAGGDKFGLLKVDIDLVAVMSFDDNDADDFSWYLVSLPSSG